MILLAQHGSFTNKEVPSTEFKNTCTLWGVFLSQWWLLLDCKPFLAFNTALRLLSCHEWHARYQRVIVIFDRRVACADFSKKEVQASNMMIAVVWRKEKIPKGMQVFWRAVYHEIMLYRMSWVMLRSKWCDTKQDELSWRKGLPTRALFCFVLFGTALGVTEEAASKAARLLIVSGRWQCSPVVAFN